MDPTVNYNKARTVHHKDRSFIQGRIQEFSKEGDADGTKMRIFGRKWLAKGEIKLKGGCGRIHLDPPLASPLT